MKDKLSYLSSNQETAREEFRRDVLKGLTSPDKSLSSKYFYDEEGSRLFEEICDLDEYYLTRTELSLMTRYAKEMADKVGPNATVIELGSGSSKKSRLLLSALQTPKYYVPIDVSREFLLLSAEEIAESYPNLSVLPVCGDYTANVNLPTPVAKSLGRKVLYFPGSTIGNLIPLDAQRLLQRIRHLVGLKGAALIGVDLKKDLSVLLPAYNDRLGVTAQFNKNLLVRMNRELGATFSIHQFDHSAIYSEELGRIEMHLVSRIPQTVFIGEVAVTFNAGETIHTENSYKYSPSDFEKIGAAAGFSVSKVWKDSGERFGVFLLETTN